MSTELTVTARAALAFGSDKARADLAELVAKSVAIIEVKNTAGREECHGAAMALIRARTSIEKIGKAAREDAQAFSKAVIQEEKALIGITAAEEARLLALRNEWDNARAAEKAEAERIERERITTIHLRLADIRAVVGLANGATLYECYGLLARLVALKLEGFEEFSDEAATVLVETIASVTTIHAAKAADEAERQRIKTEQEAERMKLAAEREELARLRSEQAAAQAKADAEAKALRDAEAADMAAKRDAFMAEIAAANKAQQEARAALEAELEMMRTALAEPAESDPEPVAHMEPAAIEVAHEIDQAVWFELTDEETARECAHYAAGLMSCTPAEALQRLVSIDWSSITMGEEA